MNAGGRGSGAGARAMPPAQAGERLAPRRDAASDGTRGGDRSHALVASVGEQRLALRPRSRRRVRRSRRTRRTTRTPATAARRRPARASFAAARTASCIELDGHDRWREPGERGRRPRGRPRRTRRRRAGAPAASPSTRGRDPCCGRPRAARPNRTTTTARSVASGFVAFESSYQRTPLASPTSATRWGMVAYVGERVAHCRRRVAPTASAAAARRQRVRAIVKQRAPHRRATARVRVRRRTTSTSSDHMEAVRRASACVETPTRARSRRRPRSSRASASSAS